MEYLFLSINIRGFNTIYYHRCPWFQPYMSNPDLSPFVPDLYTQQLLYTSTWVSNGYFKFNTNITNPQIVPLKPVPAAPFLISFNSESMFPGSQIKHTGVTLNSYLSPHPICQQMLSDTVSSFACIFKIYPEFYWFPSFPLLWPWFQASYHHLSPCIFVIIA